MPSACIDLVDLVVWVCCATCCAICQHGSVVDMPVWICCAIHLYLVDLVVWVCCAICRAAQCAPSVCVNAVCLCESVYVNLVLCGFPPALLLLIPGLGMLVHSWRKTKNEVHGHDLQTGHFEAAAGVMHIF